MVSSGSPALPALSALPPVAAVHVVHAVLVASEPSHATPTAGDEDPLCWPGPPHSDVGSSATSAGSPLPGDPPLLPALFKPPAPPVVDTTVVPLTAGTCPSSRLRCTPLGGGVQA